MSIIENNLKLELKNALLNCNCSAITLSSTDYSQSIFKRAILLNAFTNTYALYICSQNYIEKCDFDFDSNFLDESIYLALFENYMDKTLNKLKELFDANITVLDYVDVDSLENFLYNLSFDYLDDNGIKHELILYIKDYNAALNLLKKLKEHEVKEAHEIKEPIALCKIIAGAVDLTIDEFKDLNIGDAILINECPIKDKNALFYFNNFVAFGHLEGNKCILDEDLHLYNDNKEDPMSDEKPAVTNDEPKEQDLNALKDIKLSAKIVLDKLNLSINELENLKAGTSLNLNVNTLNDLTLEIQGQSIATGRLVEIDNNIAFVISNIKK